MGTASSANSTGRGPLLTRYRWLVSALFGFFAGWDFALGAWVRGLVAATFALALPLILGSRVYIERLQRNAERRQKRDGLQSGAK